MGRMYTATFPPIAITAEQDLFEITAPADAVVRIHSIEIGQETDEGDAQAEMLAYRLVRGEGTVTGGTGGATVTPTPVSKGDVAFGGVVDRNNTTKMLVGTGALKLLKESTFNAQIGLFIQYAPDERPDISPDDKFTLELSEAPADTITFAGTITFEEIGG